MSPRKGTLRGPEPVKHVLTQQKIEERRSTSAETTRTPAPPEEKHDGTPLGAFV